MTEIPPKLPDGQEPVFVKVGLLLAVCVGVAWCNYRSPSHTAESTYAQVVPEASPAPAVADLSLPDFTEDNFMWDKSSLPKKYKDVVIAGVNRIRREDSRCFGISIDPQSTSIAGSQSRPGHPVFYVTCGHGRDAVNVFFSPDDIKAGKQFTAPTYYSDPHGDGATQCQNFIKQNVNYPATVDFDWGSPSRQLPDGRTVVTIKFSAKNAFAVPDRMAADCIFDSSNMIDGSLRRIID